MRRFALLPVFALAMGSIVVSAGAQVAAKSNKQCGSTSACCASAKTGQSSTGSTQLAQTTAAAAKPAAQPATQPKPAAQPAPAKAAGGDTLEVIARVIDIPGTFPPNDLYNYVYIMKYRVLRVVRGEYKSQEILVGHYNPLIPRKQIKDAMGKYIDGDVQKFEVGARHKLVLITPIDRVWKDALEDEYFDSDMPKFFAIRVDNAK